MIVRDGAAPEKLMSRQEEIISAPLDRGPLPMGMKPSACTGVAGPSEGRSGLARHVGLLILNADDWGRDHAATDRTLECIGNRTVSSVSAMVFMKDSERAAAIAMDRGIDAGLHLNFTTAFSGPGASARLIEHQQRLAQYLGRHRFAQVVFHPGLSGSFEYAMAAQVDEFSRLYGAEPERLDGHHHMHLCSNVVFGRLLPPRKIVRRNFSFLPGEKSWYNLMYRSTVDRILARRHRLMDFFFSLPPLNPLSRVEGICSLARKFTVEVETHPANPEEYRFLMGGEILRLAGDHAISLRFAMRE